MVSVSTQYGFKIKDSFTDADFIANFHASYTDLNGFPSVKDGCRLFKLPFTCAAFEDYLVSMSDAEDCECEVSRTSLTSQLEAEARQLPFKRKSNDMFTFSQSIDIANLKSSGLRQTFPLLNDLRNFLLSDVRPWLEKLTGAKLEQDRVDFTSSVYGPNDVLLCHDDELDSRRIAFIWYLVPDDWNHETEGGTLDLFSSHMSKGTERVPLIHVTPDVAVWPWRIATSIPPKRNMFVFFEPSAYSFHQVAEVVGSRDRLSLHGWFHGPPLPRPSERGRPTSIRLVSPVHIEEELVYRWINPVYLDMTQQAKIRRRFLRSSEIQLTNFLKLEQWNLLRHALASISEPGWSLVGPYNRKHFHALRDVTSDTADAPDECRQLYRLFRSEAILVILSDLTGIMLHQSALGSDPHPPTPKRVHLSSSGNDTAVDNSGIQLCTELSDPQFRRWNLGSYTLLLDSDVVNTGWRVESILHIGGYGQSTFAGEDATVARQHAWATSWGGQIVYIAKDEQDELLSIHPVNNALSVVYTGPGTASFVKYINHSAKPSPLVNDQSESNVPSAQQTAVYDLFVAYHERSAKEVQSSSEGVPSVENDVSTDTSDSEHTTSDVESDSEDGAPDM